MEPCKGERSYISTEDSQKNYEEIIVTRQNGYFIGNHDYVANYRNQMTHHNSPNISTISTYDFQMSMPTVYVLPRTIQDYVQASSFIKEMLGTIVSELEK